MAAVKQKALEHLAETLSKQGSHFTTPEVLCLLQHYDVLMEESAAVGSVAKGLERGSFRIFLHNMFGLTDDLILDQVFKAFDRDTDNLVSAKEWIEGLSVFLRGTLDEKIKYCFHVFDLNGNHYITRDMMFHMLKDCFTRPPPDEDPEEGVKFLVEITLMKMDHDHDGRLSFKDFETAVKKETLLLEAFGNCLPTYKRIRAFEQQVFQQTAKK